MESSGGSARRPLPRSSWRIARESAARRDGPPLAGCRLSAEGAPNGSGVAGSLEHRVEVDVLPDRSVRAPDVDGDVRPEYHPPQDQGSVLLGGIGRLTAPGMVSDIGGLSRLSRRG